MTEVICECGKTMKFDFIYISALDESEDFFICECGKTKGYYEATEEFE